MGGVNEVGYIGNLREPPWTAPCRTSFSTSLHHLFLALIPNPNIKCGEKESLRLGVTVIVVFFGIVPSGILGIPNVELGEISSSFRGSGTSSWASGLHRGSSGDGSGEAINDGECVGDQQVHLHPGGPLLVVLPIEAGNIADGDVGFGGWWWDSFW